MILTCNHTILGKNQHLVLEDILHHGPMNLVRQFQIDMNPFFTQLQNRKHFLLALLKLFTNE